MPDLNKSYQWAINTCNAPNVGYSQPYRNQRTVNGITYYDCSSFIWYALKAGGFDVEGAYRTATGSAYSGNAITTANEQTWLTALGFTSQPISGEWKQGDIVWRSGHTEMVHTGGIGSGITMGAHSARYPLPDQVSINSSPSSNFTALYRFGDGGAGGYGFSLYVIAALCGNAWRESHVNPQQGELNGGGFGLFQWTGSRRTALLNWLSANGYAQDDGYGQLLFLIEENDWQQLYGEYATLTDFLNSTSTDIEYLTACFMYCWERPGTPALEERVWFAKLAYEYIQQHANDSSITDWILSPNLISVDQALHNSVLLYRFFSSGGGGGGDPIFVPKGMPVYMMLKYF